MNVVEKLVYVAEDGREFEKEEDCKRYEEILALSNHASDIYWRDTSPTEVFGWLLEHYDVKRKSEES